MSQLGMTTVFIATSDLQRCTESSATEQQNRRLWHSILDKKTPQDDPFSPKPSPRMAPPPLRSPFLHSASNFPRSARTALCPWMLASICAHRFNFVLQVRECGYRAHANA